MKIEFNYTSEELKNEVWLPVPEYEGIYEASNLGRIRTIEGKTTFTQKHGIRHWEQRILKPKFCVCSKNKKRYDGRVELWKNGKHKTYLLSRIILATFDKSYSLAQTKMTVNHIDGNSLNNRVENLEWCTRKENIQKGFQNGLYRSKKVRVINKKTNEVKEFYSISEACRFMNKNHTYIHEKMRRKDNQFENSQYRWEILN